MWIITPCCRPYNLAKLYDSIQFDKIEKWIIVYDTSKNRKYDKLYSTHPSIIEVECNAKGVAGNPQRNYGMQLVKDGWIYFLDDDNIIHPNFWSIIESLQIDSFTTFDQLRDNKQEIIYGNKIESRFIDTAMFIVHKRHIKDTLWHPDRYDADGYFIYDILNTNKIPQMYINQIGCYYNYLRTRLAERPRRRFLYFFR